MNQPIFLFGTLCDAALRQIVAGTELEAIPGSVDGVPGLLIEPTDHVWRRIGFWALGHGQRLETCNVVINQDTREAIRYIADDPQDDGVLAPLVAEEVMRLFGVLDPAELAVALPQIHSRAASRHAAGNRPSPAELEPKMSGAPIVERTQQPYTDYFAVREDWLRFPRFDGTHSDVVKRASFMGGDAVTVLPWDPRTDEVLVIRQFRHGVYARGDSNPWTLEPVAGRIDAGETPESTAHRELEEEAGLVARTLHFVGAYYPSPGAYSEHLTSYVAIADLSGRDGTVGGLVGEAEDIMSHVLPLDRLLEMVGSGAANTAPLILSAQWLAARRSTLAE